MAQSDRPSKSERKRQHRQLQDLAAGLADLSPTDIKALPLGDFALEELLQAQRMSASGARVRQLRYVAKLLEQEDREALTEVLEGRNAVSREQRRRQHRLEELRESLIAADRALEQLLQDKPELPAGQLRRLCLDARSERDCGKPKGAARALFRLLKSAQLDLD